VQLHEGVGTSEEAAEATWAFNLNGQVATAIDGNGNRAELHYDGHNRQDRWTFPENCGDSAPIGGLFGIDEFRHARRASPFREVEAPGLPNDRRCLEDEAGWRAHRNEAFPRPPLLVMLQAPGQWWNLDR